MADIMSGSARSRLMSRIRGKDTVPEMRVRRYLHSRGLRYRLHVKDLPGKPDIVFSRYRTVVFVHGCFWHQHPGCPYAVMPTSNTEFWKSKLEGNVRRDQRHSSALRAAGWRVLTVWECEVRNIERLESLAREIEAG
jgi:DNA mismatch endonuclease, patch repair protein